MPFGAYIAFVQTQLPYAVAPVAFQFRALTVRAGQLPLGGPREVVLAALLAARLARDAIAPTAPMIASRRSRATAARSWCSALTLPPGVRAAVARVIHTTELGSRADVCAAMEGVVAIVTATCDVPARAELKRLVLALGSDA